MSISFHHDQTVYVTIIIISRVIDIKFSIVMISQAITYCSMLTEKWCE